MKINNLPENFKEYAFIVARRIDDDLWFWGCFNDRNKANQVAIEIDGETQESANVERGEY